MPNIKKVQLKSKTITGHQISTKNAELKKMPTEKEGVIVYAVYHNYESDDAGEFDVLVGTTVMKMASDLREVTLEEGVYLMFGVKGELPKAIIETWTKIKVYFEDESIDERRSYETDFEKYISANEVEIYIGVNYL